MIFKAFTWLLALCFASMIASMTIAQAADEYYAEPYRPQFHFSPEKNFMNDPNGLVYYKGEYHLFYQHNPFGNTWGHMSWGHAVSRDMVHWKHLPVALAEENGIMIFSGSAVVDWNNSSGLCTNADPRDKSCLISIYTGHQKDKQTQNIAYSNDRGRTWTKYAGNPVIDINEADFRDPKVVWHAPTKKWVMVTVLAKEKKVRFYGSSDLKKWEHLSDFGPAGAIDGVWECPDLFELSVEGDANNKKWVLLVNLNPGAIAGGSGGQYFVGHFDGRVFANDNPTNKILWVDYGKDFYAAQSWSDIPQTDNRRLWLGWLSNWEYANKAPTDPWRNAQSIPRVVTLKRYPEGIRMTQKPAAEMQSLRGQHHRFQDKNIRAVNTLLREAAGETLEIIAEFELGTAAGFGFKVRKSGLEETLIGYDVTTQQIFVDRTKSGDISFDKNFPGRHAGPLGPQSGRVKMHIFVDRSSVEAFGNDGQMVITDLIFANPNSTGLEMYEQGGNVKLVSLDIWKLKSAWKTK
ncbi:MAG: glycoside hydrolase family 32 protein [Pyrinomonadaceae bacterium]|nr:glycoside hydrolase family 32 protein [Pyrinomonadaceae bacterium]